MGCLGPCSGWSSGKHLGCNVQISMLELMPWKPFHTFMRENPTKSHIIFCAPGSICTGVNKGSVFLKY